MQLPAVVLKHVEKPEEKPPEKAVPAPIRLAVKPPPPKPAPPAGKPAPPVGRKPPPVATRKPEGVTLCLVFVGCWSLGIVQCR